MERVTEAETAAALGEVIEASSARIELEAAACDACGGLFTRFLILGERRLCRGCYGDESSRVSIEDQAASVRGDLDRYAVAWMMGAGMSEREARAVPEKTSRAIATAVFASAVATESQAALAAGEVPVRGFGLSGTAGIGKSFAIAALIATGARAWIESAVSVRGYAALGEAPWITWVTWPQTVTAIRAMSLEDGGHARVAELVTRWKTTPVLVVDDIGPERMRGTYVEDWATEQLDTVVDQRSRDGGATFYTTNLDDAAIAKRYGARFYSRLCRENPLIVIGAARDRRGGGEA